MMNDKNRLVRTVRMIFRQDEVNQFLDLYRKSHKRILNFDGCLKVELWRDNDDPNVFTSYSEWESEEALEAYRQSELFRDIWRGTKRFFAERPVARSLRKLDEF